MTWHVSAMNDCLFVTDRPPSQSGTDIGPHVRDGQPNVIAKLDYPGGDYSRAEKHARLIAAAPDLLAVLYRYEQWEANLTMSQDAWQGGMAALPTITRTLWDQLLEIQRERNAAKAKAEGGA